MTSYNKREGGGGRGGKQPEISSLKIIKMKKCKEPKIRNYTKNHQAILSNYSTKEQASIHSPKQ